MKLLEMLYFEVPAVSVASQGIAKVEVFLVLDITGSMSGTSGTTTKIAALRQAASNFLTVLKYSKDTSGNYTIDKDPDDLISIGICLLYTSDAADERSSVDLGGRRIIKKKTEATHHAHRHLLKQHIKYNI